MGDYILSMENITKVYPNGFVANKNVNFAVKKGEIHALVGENGAGKSTLMKVLFGVETPEEGRIMLKGQEIKVDSPLTAIKYGIGMVHQHFMLVPSLTVAENIVLGNEPKRQAFFSFDRACKITEEISRKYNLIVDPKAKIEDLAVGMKQKVEILKALLRGAEILILDEPTAVLTPQETKELFVQLTNLKRIGHTIIFISHKLKEVKEICDRVTILRNGRSMGVEEIANITEKEISRLMVGRDVVLNIQKDKAKPKKTILKVSNVSLKESAQKYVLKNVSFSVRKGEILGVAGVEGNGQREISEIITGLAKYEHGNISISGKDIKKLSIRQIRELKTAHISEDRMTYGAVGNASILENIISDRFHKREFNRFGLIDSNKTQKLSNKLIKDYQIKCDDYSQPVRMLSGGNIQKVVAAREFSSSPELIIANQPTRGIDVGASEFVRKKLIQLRDEGAAILLISADLNEILEVSDGIIVMCGGEIVAYFEDSSVVTEEELGEYMLGLKRMEEHEIRRVAYE